MKKIYYCPGKIKDKDTYINYYISKDKKKTYCQICFEKNINNIDVEQFTLVKDCNNYYCMWQNDFTNTSLISDDIRISIVNPENYYRYKKISEFDNSCVVEIPDKSTFMIIIENLSNDPKSKISLGTIIHGEEINNYYANLETNCVLVKYMSYQNELYFDETLNNMNSIKFVVNQWKQHPFSSISTYTSTYVLAKDPINFTIHLVKQKEEMEVKSYNPIIMIADYLSSNNHNYSCNISI